jgi:hypothetical protein
LRRPIEGGNDDINSISLLNELDPISLEDAMASPHRSFWIDAMKDEWGSLLENLTFEFDRDGLPSDATLKALGSKWVFRTKTN